jgi:hypothetical protein
MLSDFDPLSVSNSSFGLSFLSPKPPVPAFVIMTSVAETSTSSLSIPSSVGGDGTARSVTSVSGGHVTEKGPSPEPGSITTEAIEVDDTSTSLPSVWELDHVLKTGDSKATQTWKCLWCNMVFRKWNATKVLYHLAKKAGNDVRVCKAAHDSRSKELYRLMLAEKERTNANHQARVAQLESMVGEGQQSMAVMFEAARQRGSNGGGGGGAAVVKGDCTKTGRTRVFASEMTVEASTSSQLTMAIADFVHSTGLPFSVTQGVYFRNILKFARGVPMNYQPPHRNAISDSLLKINYNRRMEK